MKYLYLFLSLLPAFGAEQIKLTALDKTSLLSTNTILLISTVVPGVSSNSYGVYLETLIRAAITNSSTLNWTISEGKMVAWSTNLSSTEIGDTVNFATLTVNPLAYGVSWNGSTNVPTQGDIYTKIESLSIGGSAVYVNASSISAPNFATGTNMIFEVGAVTNIYGFPTNIVNAQVSASAAIAASKLDSTLLTESEGNAAYQPLDSDLTSIAAITTTAHGRGLLDDADATASRVSIGAVIGVNVQAYNADLDDLADGSLTGTKVGFVDTDGLFTASNVQAAIEEFNDSINAGVPNGSGAKVHWSELLGVPAGIADGTDDTAAGGEAAGTVHVVGTSVLYQLAFFTNAMSTNISGANGVMIDETETNVLAGGGLFNSVVITQTVTLGDGVTALLETWPLGGMRTNAGSNVGITNYIFEIWNSNATFNADIFAGSTNIPSKLNSLDTLKANLASPTLTGNPLAPTPASDDNDTSIATTAFFNQQLTNGAVSANWNEVTLKAPNLNTIHDYVILGDPDLDGFPSIFDPIGTAGLVNVNSSGVAQTPINSHAGLVAVVTDLNSATRTATGLTYHTGGTGNVFGYTNYQDLVFPSRVSTTTMMVTNDNTSSLWGLVTYDGAAGTNTNFAVFRLGTVPYDLDTSAAMVLRGLSIRVSGTDTDAAEFSIGLWSPASSSIYAPADFTSFSTFINFDSGTLTSPAANDIFYFSDVTLTGWAAAVTVGRPLIIGIAKRAGNNTDSITILSGTIQSVRTQ